MSKKSRQQRETIEATEVTRVDAWEPDYDSKCLSCGQTPTVTGVAKGKVVYAGGLCGPCTWGSDARDPADW